MAYALMIETVGRFKKDRLYRITDRDWLGRDLYELGGDDEWVEGS